jgi:hypothetical protein
VPSRTRIACSLVPLLSPSAIYFYDPSTDPFRYWSDDPIAAAAIAMTVQLCWKPIIIRSRATYNGMSRSHVPHVEVV